MIRKSKAFLIVLLIIVALVPNITFAYKGNASSNSSSGTRSCPGPLCYGTHNYAAYVTLYKYEASTGEIEIKCGYRVPQTWSKMPEIKGSNFVKWIEKNSSGILSNKKDYGVFSAGGVDESSQIATFFNSGKVGNCTSGVMPVPPTDTTAADYLTKKADFEKEVSKYYIAVEPEVDLHKAGGDTNVKTVRYQCSKSGTNTMGTFQDFLRSVFDSQTEKGKNDCSDSSGKKCLGENISTAMVGEKNSASPFWMIETSKSKSYTCAGSGSNDEYRIKASKNHLPKGLILKVNPSNKYELIGTYNSTTYRVNRSTIGIAFYWVPGFGSPSTVETCEDSCASVKSDDDKYLACAEKYCDAEAYDPTNPDAKQSCIIESCKYSPSPMTCITTIVNEDGTTSPSNENDPNKDIATETNTNKTTTCGTISGTTKSCQVSTTTDAVLASRKYYSMSCVEKTNFDFKDTSQTSLVPGSLLEYNVELDGNKVCKVYFDYVSWKIDYASISSKDPDAAIKKTELKKLIDNFNKAFVPNVSGGTVGVVETFKKNLGFQSYDIKKVSIESKYAEIINGESETSSNYKLVAKGSNEENTDTVTNSKIVKVPVIENGAVSSYIDLNYYTTSSNRLAYYEMPGQCVRDAATGDVYTATGNKCDDNTNPISGFYTNFNATPSDKLPSGLNHKVITTASVTASGDSDYYVSDTDTCPYNTKPGKCTLSVKSGSYVSGTKCTYNSNVVIGLSTENIPLNTIVAKEIRLNDDSFEASGMEDEDTINKTNTCTNTKNTVYGKIKTTTGTISCELPIEFKGNCSCSLNLVAGTDNIYELVNVSLSGTPSYYYRVNGGEEIQIAPDLINGKYLIKTEDISLPFRIEGIIKNGTDTATCPIANSGERCTSKYKPSDTSSIAAYCKTNWKTDLAGYKSYDACVNKCSASACRETFDPTDSTGIYNYCKTSWQDDPAGYESLQDCRTDCSVKKCTTIFKTEELMEIKNYCKEYWDQDEARYQSYDDCVTGCSFTCNKITNTTYEGIISECSTNYDSWGFKSSDNCATTCCVKLGTCDGTTDYVYRPVNPKNPFPNSYLDKTSLSTTENMRKIGANWFGKDEYITNDIEDKTSGADDVENNPEYEIILDEAAIRKIRKDNELYNATKAKSGGNVYIDYVYNTDTTSSTNKVKYESKFIRDSDSNNGGGGFYDYFTYIEGNKKGSILEY